jgi:hypothetical protein
MMHGQQNVKFYLDKNIHLHTYVQQKYVYRIKSLTLIVISHYFLVHTDCTQAQKKSFIQNSFSVILNCLLLVNNHLILKVRLLYSFIPAK